VISCRKYGEKIKVYIILIGKPEGKIILVEPRLTFENNIKRRIRITGYGSVDCIQLLQDSVQFAELGNTVTTHLIKTGKLTVPERFFRSLSRTILPLEVS
jgi:hypothetical protein